jgi:cytochrome c peroxidase
MTLLIMGAALIAVSPLDLQASSSRQFVLAELPSEDAGDPPEVAIGERLFKEPRFSQFFYRVSKGRVNAELENGDPALDKLETIEGRMKSPFQGQAMSCASCHMVDQAVETVGGGMRLYADFAKRSPVTAREDNQSLSLRNTQAMVQVTIPRSGPLFLHHDGEFTSTESLVLAALRGRNMGWLPGEEKSAMAHIADVIRRDDGKGELAREFGGSYAKVLKGVARDLADEHRLPAEYRIDVRKSGDEEIVEAVVALMTAYTDSLRFQENEEGLYAGSAYDLFLEKNHLPRKPREGETDRSYSERLREAVMALAKPVFVTKADGSLKTHGRDLAFGPKELQGLKVFLNDMARPEVSSGACVRCHAAPHFTDFAFHNVGLSQTDYEAVHGMGSFARLRVPSVEERKREASEYLVPTSTNPSRKALLRSVPIKEDPKRADLGLWNYVANADYVQNQKAYGPVIAASQERTIIGLSDGDLLSMALGLFRTPSLRDLGHSAPYFHTGSSENLSQVVMHYFQVSQRARMGQMRNISPHFKPMQFSMRDSEALVAFLRSLDEDYD